MAFNEGTLIGPYEIVGKIGAGGMGEVWKAKDTRLGRDVAIKVLPAAFAEDAGLVRRFHQEAKVLASLNHPNVVQVFEAGEHEGAPYLVMELLSGETLRERLRDKSISPKRAAEITREAALGLAAAHEKGILHRDLKPENLFLTKDGHVKVLDFGLAKFEARKPIGQESETRAFLSEPGTIVGTSGYMSPEQVLGETLDHRSDLFSLGVILWEMLAGKRPFAGDSSVEVMHAILKEDPPELEETLKVPPALERILRSCLAKEPAGRFHSAHDLAFALESISTTIDSQVPATGIRPALRMQKALRLAFVVLGILLAVGALLVWKPWRPAQPPWDPRCVAILPFENRTGDPSMDHLGQQVVDFVRQDLQQVDNLKVAADTAIAPGGEPARRLAGATQARYVAAGAYYLHGEGIEIQARIVDPWNGKVIYTLGPWQRPRAEAAGAFAEARRHLAGALAWCFAFKAFEPGATWPPSMEAFLAYQEAVRVHRTDPHAAVAKYKLAQALDPDWFFPKVSIWICLVNLEQFEEAGKAAASMDADPRPHTDVERFYRRWCQGDVAGHNLDVLKALEEMTRKYPGADWLIFVRGEHELRFGFARRAIRTLSGIRQDYLAASWYLSKLLCQAYHQAGDYSEQLRTSRKAQATFPDVLSLRVEEVGALAALGRVSEIDPILEVVQRTPPSPTQMSRSLEDVVLSSALELAVHGQREASRRLAGKWWAAYSSLAPEFRHAKRKDLVTVLTLQGQDRQALDLAQVLADEQPDDIAAKGRLGALFARTGQTGQARRLQENLAAIARPYLLGGPAYQQACIAAQTGDKETAVGLLRKALSQGLNIAEEVHLDLFLEPLRGYPPYEELMKPKD